MDIIEHQTGGDSSRKNVFSHIFSTTEEGKAEILNISQYAVLGVIPIVVLNKLIQRFVPEADTERSSLELLVEVFIQIIIMFCGIVLIHRTITYIPTYSGYKYENLTLTNVILAFLMVVLSIQTKLGLKVNILVDRIYDLWDGPSHETPKQKSSGGGYSSSMISHAPSQADYLDHSPTADLFPPAPKATAPMRSSGNANTGGGLFSSMSAPVAPPAPMGPMAANSVLGGGFGSLF